MAASPCKLLSGLPTTVQNEGVHSPRHNAYRLQHWRRRRPVFFRNAGVMQTYPASILNTRMTGNGLWFIYFASRECCRPCICPHPPGESPMNAYIIYLIDHEFMNQILQILDISWPLCRSTFPTHSAILHVTISPVQSNQLWSLMIALLCASEWLIRPEWRRQGGGTSYLFRRHLHLSVYFSRSSIWPQNVALD